MKKLTRRDMLKISALGSAGVILAACTQAAPTAAPQSGGQTSNDPAPTQAAPKKEAVKVTLVESWFGVPQYKESIDPVNQLISEKMQADGVPVFIESMILDDHENKYPVLYASGADFTMAFDAPWYKMTTLRTQNALLPLEELIEAMGANLKEEITEKIYKANFIDGHLYGIPAAFYYSGTGGVIFREDLRKKYDAPMPTSEGGWASLEPYLEAIQKNHPDMIPFANVLNYALTDVNSGRHGWGPGPTKTGVMIFDIEKGFTLEDFEDNPFVVENARLLRSWWEKGLVNKTDLTSSAASQNVQVDYVFPGKAAACVENEPDYKWVEQTKNLQSSIPDGEIMGVDMTGMRAGKVKGIGNLKQWNFMVFNATAPKEQHEAGIQFFNWLANSQDNMDLWLMGVDGTNYKKEDNLRFSEIEGVDQARNYRRQWYVSGISGRFQRLPADLPKSAEEAITFFSTESNWIFNPYEQFEPDTKALEVDTAKLNAVYDEAIHGFASGQEPTDEAIQKMKQMLDDAGRQEYKANLQKMLDEYIASQA